MKTTLEMKLRRPDPIRVRMKRRIAWSSLSAFVVAIPAMTLSTVPQISVPASQRAQMKRNIDAVMPLAPIVAIEPKRIQFKKSDADGEQFRSVNSYYVGKARLQIDWSDVDLVQNVRYMWDRKRANFNVTPATAKSVDAIVARFEQSPHATTTLKDFVKRADKIVDEAHDGIDFDRLCDTYGLDEERCKAVNRLSDRINGRMLIAYGMTELFPSHDGETNRGILDMMLRRAGEDYLNAIPALGDKYLSMGFYQFTSFAVRHDETGRQGANVVSQFAQQGIPGSVMLLNNADQHRAAFYFATYNIMLMVRSLNARQLKDLRGHSVEKEELTIFMAASHHLPKSAQRSFAAWLGEHRRSPLREYLRGDLRTYGKKSVTNYEAL